MTATVEVLARVIDRLERRIAALETFVLIAKEYPLSARQQEALRLVEKARGE